MQEYSFPISHRGRTKHAVFLLLMVLYVRLAFTGAMLAVHWSLWILEIKDIIYTSYIIISVGILCNIQYHESLVVSSIHSKPLVECVYKKNKIQVMTGKSMVCHSAVSLKC